MIPLKGDVTSRSDLLELAETVKQRSGYINLLVNNAGVAVDSFKPWAPEDNIKSFQEKLWQSGSPEEFAKTFETNVAAVWFTTVAFLELLHLGNCEREGYPNLPTSQVITVSSVAGLRRDDKQFSLSYALSKAASLHLGKSLANILNGFKIRSNVIAPGIYPSRKFSSAFPHLPLLMLTSISIISDVEMTQGVIESMGISSEAVPLQRCGDIQDMGGLMLYLASRAGAYTNGCVFLTDGGRLSLFPSSY
jgi:NAD(P)-dependent dehydrogenase (short-subunit alcohol dehydrogenase family)